MGQVIFKKGQAVQALSGTYAGAEFRSLQSGRTIVHIRTAETIVDECVDAIQARMGDMRDAIRQRKAIKKRVGRFYGRLKGLTEDEEELKRWILQAWYNSRRRLPSRKVKTPKIVFDKPPTTPSLKDKREVHEIELVST
jgi:hypothetical protein